MKMLVLISAMMIFFAFALQNAVKDMTYSHSTTQVQKPNKAVEKYEMKTATIKDFKTSGTRIVALK